MWRSDLAAGSSSTPGQRAQILRPSDIEEGKAIGGGQFGKVRSGWLLSSSGRHPVVIKTNITKNPAADMKELSVYALAPHSNIVRFFGIVAYDDHLDYVMEVASGGSLDAVLRDANLAKALRSDPARVSRLLRGVLCALDHLHANSFLHLDLAARNVLLSSADAATQAAKLADWGECCIVYACALNLVVRSDSTSGQVRRSLQVHIVLSEFLHRHGIQRLLPL